MIEVSTFNPYLKWLGIPVTEQPPHHYRLLGIQPLEDDFDIIDAAAEQRMGFLRKHQSGPHAQAAAKLMNEVSQARLCLLNSDKKQAYDAQLKMQTSAAPPKPVTPLFTVEALAVETFSFESVSDGDVMAANAASPAGERFRSPIRLWGTLCATALLIVAGLLLWRSSPSPSQTSTSEASSHISHNNAVRGKTFETDSTFPSSQRSQVTPASRLPAPTRQEASNAEAKVATTLAVASTSIDANSADASAPMPSAPVVATTLPPPVTPGPPPVQPPMPPPLNPLFDEAKLKETLNQLEKSNQARKVKRFAAYKAQLLKIKSKFVGKKALSPAIEAEYTKLVAACDRQEFLPLRVSTTVSFGNHDYAYISGRFSWNAARERCESLGGHLATLNSDAERDFIVVKFLNPQDIPPWLGGFDEPEEGVWRWVTGEPWQFGANIDNEFGQAHSLTYWKNSGGFHDTPGCARLGILCEWDAQGTPAQISLGSEDLHFQAQWDAFVQSRVDADQQRQQVFQAVYPFATRLFKQGQLPQAQELYAKHQLIPPPAQRESYRKSEYAILRDAKTWNEARRHCVAMGGHLVIFDTPGEREFAMSLALKNGTSVWIGHSDEHQEGFWRWVDRSQAPRPETLSNSDAENGGWLEVDNRRVTWHDQSTELRSSYLCEWEIE